MKNYITYKKVNRSYFNLQEILALPVIPLLVITVVSYGIMYFVGLPLTIFINFALALFLTVYLHGLKNAFSNNASNRQSKEIPGIVVILSLLPTFLLALGAQLLAIIGPYIFLQYQKKGIFHQKHFIIWAIVVFGLPILFFVARELKYWFTVYYQAYYFTTLPLTIDYDPDLLISAEEISFLNTRKRIKSTFSNTAILDFHKKNKISETPSIAEYNERFYNPVLIKLIAIPKQSNVLKIIYTSHLEETNYQEEVVFPYDKLHFEQEKYPTNKSKFLRGKKSETVVLSLQKGGVLQLFNRQGPLIQPVQIGQKTQSEKAERITSTPDNKPSSGLEDLSVNKQLYKRMATKNRIFYWQMTGAGLEDHEIRVRDVKNYLFEDEKLAINSIEKRPLPLSFEFTYGYYSWLKIHVNPEKLLDQMLPAQLDDPNAVFDLNVSVDIQKGEVDLKLIYKGAELLFSDWEKEIKSHRWEDAKNKLLKKQQFEQNQVILNQIFNLLEQKQYHKAKKICKKQIQLQPDFAILYFYEARLLFYTKGYAASYAQENYFIEKTAKEPYALARIYNHYGCLLDEEKRYKEALTYFDKAYNAYPKEIFYLANKAEILYKLKETEKAVKYAKQCVEMGYDSDFINKLLNQEHI